MLYQRKTLIILIAVLFADISAMAKCSQNGSDLIFDKKRGDSPAGEGSSGSGGGSTPIYMYAAGPVTGAMGGRTGLNTTCQGAKPGSLTCSGGIVSFISMDNGSDEIVDLPIPAGRPIQGPTGIAFKNSWEDLKNFVGTTTAADAGILPAATLWWSFSSAATPPAGLPAAQNCTNGTSSTGNGRVGQSDLTGSSFYNTGGAPESCGNSHNVLCLCY